MKNLFIYLVCFSIFSYYFYDQTTDYLQYQTVSSYHLKSVGNITYKLELTSRDDKTITDTDVKNNLRFDDKPVRYIKHKNKLIITSKFNDTEDLTMKWLGGVSVNITVEFTVNRQASLMERFESKNNTYMNISWISNSIIKISKMTLLKEPYDTRCRDYKDNEGKAIKQIEALVKYITDNPHSKGENFQYSSCDSIQRFATNSYIMNYKFFNYSLNDFRINYERSHDITIDTSPLISTGIYVYISISLIATAFGLSVYDTCEFGSGRINYKCIDKFFNAIILKVILINSLHLCIIVHCIIIISDYFNYPHSTTKFVGPPINNEYPKITICSPVEELKLVANDINPTSTFKKIDKNLKNISDLYKLPDSGDNVSHLTTIEYYWNYHKCSDYMIKGGKFKVHDPYLAQISVIQNISNSILLLNDANDQFFSNIFLSSGFMHTIIPDHTITIHVSYNHYLPSPYESNCVVGFKKMSCWNDCILSKSINITFTNSFINEDNYHREYFSGMINNDCDQVCNFIQCESSYWNLIMYAYEWNNFTFQITSPKNVIDITLFPSNTISSTICQVLSAISFWLGLNLTCYFRESLEFKLNYKYVIRIVIFGVFSYHIFIQTYHYFRYETVTSNLHRMIDFKIPYFYIVTRIGDSTYKSPMQILFDEKDKFVSNVSFSLVDDRNIYDLSVKNDGVYNLEKYLLNNFIFSKIKISDEYPKIIKFVDGKGMYPIFKLNFTSNTTTYAHVGNTQSISDRFITLSGFRYFYFSTSKFSLLPPPYETNCIAKHKKEMFSCYNNELKRHNMSFTRLSILPFDVDELIRPANHEDFKLFYSCVGEIAKYPPLCESYNYVHYGSEKKRNDNFKILKEEPSDYNFYFYTNIHCQFFPTLNFQTFAITIFGIIDLWFSVNLLHTLKTMSNYYEMKMEKIKEYKIERKIKPTEPVTDCDNIPEIPTYYVN